MSKELIDRLRDNRVTGFNLTIAACEAADAIEQLERELIEARAALLALEAPVILCRAREHK